MAAKGMEFRWRWTSGTISTNSRVIWGMSVKKILHTIAELKGRRPPKVRLPTCAIYPIVYCAEGYARLSGKGEPFVTVDGLRLAKKLMYFSSDKAIEELGYKSRPARSAIRDAILGFKIPLASKSDVAGTRLQRAVAKRLGGTA